MFLKDCCRFCLDWLMPIECMFCGKYGKLVCDECLENIEFNPINRCPFCGKFSFLGLTCYDCKKSGKELSGLFCYGFYNDVKIKKIIHFCKYRYLSALADPLSAMLSYVIKNIKKGQQISALPKIIKEDTLYIPVPLHKRKLRERGFNQSELLLKRLADRKEILEKDILLDCLIRFRYTDPQAKMPADEKINNLKNAFAYNGKKLKNRNVVLIDDVSTSGITLNECAKVLRKNGTKKVWGVVIARG